MEPPSRRQKRGVRHEKDAHRAKLIETLGPATDGGISLRGRGGRSDALDRPGSPARFSASLGRRSAGHAPARGTGSSPPGRAAERGARSREGPSEGGAAPASEASRACRDRARIACAPASPARRSIAPGIRRSRSTPASSPIPSHVPPRRRGADACRARRRRGERRGRRGVDEFTSPCRPSRRRPLRVTSWGSRASTSIIRGSGTFSASGFTVGAP